jgi:uncharacterized Zn finger protein
MGAPWWRCIHCGCDEYEDHAFIGHMQGVPMIHCANCKVLHSPPDPNSKAALRWQISELAEALMDWRNTYLCPCSDIEESAARLLEVTDAALAASGETPK